MMTKLRTCRTSLCLVHCVLFVTWVSSAAEPDLTKLPPPATVTVEFDRDIKPIFEKTCLRCHGPEKPKSHFRLDNRDSALRGGENNSDDIVPGDSTKSRLIHYVRRLLTD